jgi:uncharacterized membrane protein
MVQAYGYAALVSSGPWVLSILSLALLGFLASDASRQEMSLFYIAVTHVFAFSLIFTGPLQLVLTRYAADRIYEKREELVFPAFLSAAAATACGALAVGGVFFFFFTTTPLLFRIGATELFVAVSSLWLAAVLLSAVKEYWQVLICFGVGYGSSFVLAWRLQPLGVSAIMYGFAMGQVILLAYLVRILYRQFGGRASGEHSLFSYFRKHWALAACGFLYNAGIWSDKLLHWWFSPHNMHVAGSLYASPFYDQAVSLSFLSIAPGMAVFLLSMETQFAGHYSAFFETILNKASLSAIRQAKQAMLTLKEGLSVVMKVQGLVTFTAIVLAEDILRVTGLGSVQTIVFQTTLLGVFLLVLFLAFLTVLFYLDRPRQALLCCAAFAATNILVTSCTLFGDERWYGFGFVVAAAVGMVLAARFANYHLHLLEYETFTAQDVY